MICKDCKGVVGLNRKKLLLTAVGITSQVYSPAYPCTKCGRLHWEDGEPVASNKTGEKAYLENGIVVAKK